MNMHWRQRHGVSKQERMNKSRRDARKSWRKLRIKGSESQESYFIPDGTEGRRVRLLGKKIILGELPRNWERSCIFPRFSNPIGVGRGRLFLWNRSLHDSSSRSQGKRQGSRQKHPKSNQEEEEGVAYNLWPQCREMVPFYSPCSSGSFRSLWPNFSNNHI